ncbi:amidohydrolase family protein [Faunimonas sp. B44]|uniref:amidohydrolase family protein n=1 Tax=Faunimonas sp. B44 TaxID=3461493 RepID=UPI004043C31D
MSDNHLDRRSVLLGATAIGTAGLLPKPAIAQGTAGPAQADRPSASLPTRGEFVIKNAHVLTMEHNLGELPDGDVHVRDGVIVGVGRTTRAGPDVEVIDGSNTICMPGFVETHWHLWTSCCRPLLREGNADRGYFPVTSGLGPHYTPEDSYRSVRHGLAEALYSGITTVHNWAHNVRSPEHADAELRAMRDTGIRGRFSYGTPQRSSNEEPMDSADLARVKREWLPENPLLSLGICSRNVGNNTNQMRGAISIEMAHRDWGAARELGLPITMHTSSGSPVKMLDEAGLLGPDVQLVHPLLTTPEDREILAKHRTSYSMAPLGESRRSAKVGEIQLAELLEANVPISMSIDHIATFNCDCFNCMRTLYALHQHRIGDAVPLSPKRLVELATIDGAYDMGVGDKVGSLSPGKRADIILVRTDAPNMAPIGDPYDALVNLAHPGNVDTVIVDGRILRRKGDFTALDFQQVVRDSQQTAAELAKRANWT